MAQYVPTRFLVAEINININEPVFIFICASHQQMQSWLPVGYAEAEENSQHVKVIIENIFSCVQSGDLTRGKPNHKV